MKREELIEQINNAGKKMSTAEVIFHQAIAQKAGLSGADHKYLDLIMEKGAMTAGKLAEFTGLTTGAVTGLINRLENNGLVERKFDPNDKRKVLVVPNLEKAFQTIGPIFSEMLEGLDELYKNFTTEELIVIKKYLDKSLEFFSGQIEILKTKK